MIEEINKKKALYIVEDAESAQFRYRVKNVAEALDSSTEWHAKWMLASDIDSVKLDDIDLVVILRQTAKDRKILDFVDLAQKCGIKVLFDLDDLIFDYRDILALLKGTNSKNVIYWMGYILGIRRIAKKVDGFITTNDFLAKKLKRSFSKPAKIIPNSLNDAQIRVSEDCIKNKEHEGFVIGYFSGSPTHVRDLRMIESEIFKFLDQHKDAKLKLVGFMEPSSEMKKRIKNGQVEILKFMNYLGQMEMMSRVDVNIAPLVISEFTNCKSELKFFEAAAVETTTIASPIYTFKKAISDGKTGFLAKPGEWYDKLEYLYNNPKENQKIAKAARNYALENYHGKKFAKEVGGAYNFFM